jgi:NADH dehydrogenase
MLRNQALGMLELASLKDDPLQRRVLLTFVVAGGGFAGVETVGALNDFLREAIAYYPALSEKELRVVLIHPNTVVLPELNESLGRYSQARLADRGVEILTQTRVLAFSDRGVELSDNETIATQTLVWTAGVTPPAVLQALPVEKKKGRVVVDETLEAPGFPGVWAVGDCAWVPNSETGQPHPPTAQHALREAVRCAKNIVATIQGLPKTPFRFATLGQLATIGRHSGVAEVFGFRLSGFVAWCLWRAIYLAKLPTWQKKLRVALRWILEFGFPRDFTQQVTLHGIDQVTEHLAYVRQHPEIPGPVASRPTSTLSSAS